jgi:hypothetical protein
MLQRHSVQKLHGNEGLSALVQTNPRSGLVLANYPFLTPRLEIKKANLYRVSRGAIRAGFLTPLQ